MVLRYYFGQYGSDKSSHDDELFMEATAINPLLPLLGQLIKKRQGKLTLIILEYIYWH